MLKRKKITTHIHTLQLHLVKAAFTLYIRHTIETWATIHVHVIQMLILHENLGRWQLSWTKNFRKLCAAGTTSNLHSIAQLNKQNDRLHQAVHRRVYATFQISAGQHETRHATLLAMIEQSRNLTQNVHLVRQTAVIIQIYVNTILLICVRVSDMIQRKKIYGNG
jgi:hypothetical protein